MAESRAGRHWRAGKLPAAQLHDLLAGLPQQDPRVILGPKIGEDAARAISLTHYNAACMYSRLKKTDQAFEHLNIAINSGAMGFCGNMADQIEGDGDFDNIRSDPRYAKALEKAKKAGS